MPLEETLNNLFYFNKPKKELDASQIKIQHSKSYLKLMEWSKL